MSDLDALKADIRKMSAKATSAKLNLHDLSEDLPMNWTTIPDVAKAAYEAYEALEAARKKLADMEAA